MAKRCNKQRVNERTGRRADAFRQSGRVSPSTAVPSKTAPGPGAATTRASLTGSPEQITEFGKLVLGLQHQVTQISQLVWGNVESTLEPALFIVVERGKQMGPFTDTETVAWREVTCEILLDCTVNMLYINLDETTQPIEIPLDSLDSQLIDLLRVFCEKPGQLFEPWSISRALGWATNHEILKRRVRFIRDFLESCGIPRDLVETVRNASRELSPSGGAYRIGRKRHCRVIRYPKINLPSRHKREDR